MSDLLHELDHRCHDRVDVRLLWRESDDQVLVSVADAKTGACFVIEVLEGERALDVFHHPYAYAEWHGIETGTEVREELSWAA